MKTFKLICTVTMDTYFVKSWSEYGACEQLARKLGYPIDTIDVFYNYNGKENDAMITENQAKEFWRDLMGTLWGDPNTKVTHGIMGAGLIADHMNISTEKANAFMWKCVDLGLSDRQGGAFVV